VKSLFHIRHAESNWDDPALPARAKGSTPMAYRLRFTVGVLHHFAHAKTSIAQKMAHLNRNIRLVLDYLRMTNNSIGNDSP
jgi:hypothetical protein